MYKISFLVPMSDVDKVKEAMFKAGGGKIGNYTHCAWQVLGEGEFIPHEVANPFVGEKNQSNKVPEYYVHIICHPDVIKPVLAALKSAHPYEQPTYELVKLELL